MSEQVCAFCGKLFKEDEDIIASVVTKFVALKSKRVYALAKPTECLSMRHLNCDELTQTNRD
jgi:hypothetical protein